MVYQSTLLYIIHSHSLTDLQPVDVQRFRSINFSVKPSQLSGLYSSRLHSREEARRYRTPAATPLALFDHQVCRTLGSPSSVLGNDGEHARVFQEHLAENEDGLGGESVDLQVGRAGNWEVLPVPLDFGQWFSIKLDLEFGLLVLKSSTRLNLLRKYRWNSWFLKNQYNSRYYIIAV